MSTQTEDHELLRRYAGQASEDAFAELVKRHLDFVFAAALREVREPALAADLAQAAFILLARKAGSIRATESLAGWLFQTIRYAARNARRAAWRREHYEKEAAAMNTLCSETESEAAWERLAPLLNDALASLSAGDRSVVTLRFYEKMSNADIAARLQVPEASARKRVSRAVERMRRFFARRGVSVTGTSLMTVLMAESVSAAPPGLVGAVTAASLTKGAGASAPVAALVKDGLSGMVWAQVKTAAGVGALGALALGGLIVAFADVGRTGGSRGFVFEEIQFTNRFVDKAWGSDVTTADDRPHLFVRTTQRTRSLDVFGRLFSSAAETNVTPLAVIFEVADERGDSIEGVFTRRARLSAGSQSDLREVSFFPRRGTNLWLRLLDREFNPLGEVKVANPAFARHPELTPEPLPATRSDGELSVRLEAFVSGPNALRDPSGATVKYPRRQTTLTFSLREANRAARSWAVRTIAVSDATGNHWQESRPTAQPLPGADARFQTRLYLALWSGEPAWQVEMEFMRTNAFDRADVLTVPAVPVPATNQVHSLNQDELLNGHPVRLLSLAGPQPGSESDPARPPGHLVMQLDGRGVGATWQPGLIEARDDQGRPWSVTDYRRNGTRVTFRLHGPAEAQTLTLKLARQELRRVTFVARLTEAAPSAGQAK